MQRFVCIIAVLTYICHVQSISGTVSQADMFPLFNNLVENIVTCDIKILHDGLHSNIDWSNVNFPSKIIKMSEFIFKDYEYQRIGETKSRAASHCKLAFIISTPYVDPNGISLKTNLNLDGWIFSAMYGQFQFEFFLSSVVGNSEFLKYARLDKIVIAFITLETYRNNLGTVYFTHNFTPYKISVLFISLEKKKIEICTWLPKTYPESPIIYNLGENLSCNGGGNSRKTNQKKNNFYFITNLESILPGWCLEQGINQVALKFHYNKLKDSNPFHPMATDTQFESALKIIFFVTNETLVLEKSCSYRDD